MPLKSGESKSAFKPEFSKTVAVVGSVDEAQSPALLYESIVIGLGANDGRSRVAIKEWRGDECVFYGPPRESLLT